MAPKKGATNDVSTNVVAFGRVRKNLKMGCVGLPNVGKSSLFNLLTEQNAAAENYPFCTIEPNEARCAVPDVRYVSLLDGSWVVSHEGHVVVGFSWKIDAVSTPCEISDTEVILEVANADCGSDRISSATSGSLRACTLPTCK